MDRAYQSGAAGSAPSAPASPSTGYPTAGNPSTGTSATKPGPYWYHMIMEELMAIITAAGIAPAQGNLTQLLTALRSSGVFQTPGQFDGSTKVATTEFVRRELGRRRGFVAYNASKNLGAADAGMYIAFDGTGPCAAVLPDPATLPAGTSFFIEAASRDVTVTATNATFDGPAAKTQNVASVLLPGASGNTCCEFIVQAPGRYRAIGGEGLLSPASGYVKLANGLIMQWGQVLVSSGSTATATLPVAFPNAALAGFVTLIGAPVGSSYSGSINSLSTTQVQVGHWASVGASASYRYLVLGH